MPRQELTPTLAWAPEPESPESPTFGRGGGRAHRGAGEVEAFLVGVRQELPDVVPDHLSLTRRRREGTREVELELL
ncbi:MAG TPA: hypothetical protein VHE30_17895, partial [Polyangiaceae bacterium]|nr:hypothetical protein [Polyangiaceae bacterium]